EYKFGMREIEKLHAQYKFELIYSHTLAALIGLLFARKRNVRHLWHVQEILAKPRIINKTFKKLLGLKVNDKAVYDSIATMNFWIEGDKNLAAKSEAVWNGLDVSAKPSHSPVEISEIRKTYFQADESQTVIGLIGRINSWKGQQLLLKSFASIADKYPEAKLVFIGSAPPNQDFFLHDLEDKIKSFGLNDRVIIIPFQDNI